MSKPNKIEDRTLLFINEYNKLKDKGIAPTHIRLAEIIGLKNRSSISEILGKRQNIQPDQWGKFKAYYKISDAQNSTENSVPRETVLLEVLVQLVQTQNKILEDQKASVTDRIDNIKEKVVNTDQNVSKLLRALENVGTQIQTSQEVVLESLERLEGKPSNGLQSEVYKKIVQKGQRNRKQNKTPVGGKIGKAL